VRTTVSVAVLLLLVLTAAVSVAAFGGATTSGLIDGRVPGGQQ
jgi:hypothetical protein